MMDYIAGLVQRGIISPDAADGLVQHVADLKNRMPFESGGGIGTNSVYVPRSYGVMPKGGFVKQTGKSVDTANENQTIREYEYNQRSAPRLNALNKIIENKDFKPALADGKMKFQSLTRDENKAVNGIGYGRAPDVTYEMEQSDPAAAWEKNIRYWRDLETPSKE